MEAVLLKLNEIMNTAEIKFEYSYIHWKFAYLLIEIWLFKFLILRSS